MLYLEQKLEYGARRLLPWFVTLLLAIASVAHWPLPFVGPVSPSLPFAAIFCWAIYRPDLFGHAAAFITGLLVDALNYLPIGLSALIFVAAFQIILRQRRYLATQNFMVLWLWFTGAAFTALFIEWLVVSILQLHLVMPLPLLMQGALTAAIFPVPAWIIIRLQNFLPPQS